MIIILRTTSTNADFLNLVKQLDAELDNMYGSEMKFYNEFNTVKGFKQVVVAYDNNTPAGCGAVKEYEPGIMEVKRVFVDPGFRGKGVAEKVMIGLEDYAREHGCKGMILETGDLQHAAIALYKKLGYKHIANYGQYAKAPSSICFNKLF